MTTQQTDALQCATDLEYSIARHGMQDAFTLNAYRAMKMVRTQQARIADLEAQHEAIGAGGVSGPLIGCAAPPTAQAEAENLRKALQFYADKQHFAISEEDARDTAMVEDGSIAKMALAGQPINFADEDEDEAAPPTSAEGVEHG